MMNIAKTSMEPSEQIEIPSHDFKMNANYVLKEYHPEILFFENVKNPSEVKTKIVNGGLPCAAINPLYVVDSFQILTATQLALESLEKKALRTRSLFSEIVYNMSPNKKIADSLKKFGMNDNDTSILCVVLNEADKVIVCSTVQGEQVPYPQDIKHNENEVRKAYKIKDEELAAASILDAVINRITTKEYVSW